MGALGDARFRRLLAGNSLSSFGDSALYLSLGIWAKDLTGSNAAAGAIFLAQGLGALSAPFAGHLADRVPRRRLLVVTNAATALVVLSLLGVRSEAQLWVMYLVAVAYGAAFGILAAGGAGLVKDMLADEDLATANAASTTISQGLRIASPLAGAALYAAFGGSAVAILDSASFLAAIAALLTVHVAEAPRRSSGATSLCERNYWREPPTCGVPQASPRWSWPQWLPCWCSVSTSPLLSRS